LNTYVPSSPLFEYVYTYQFYQIHKAKAEKQRERALKEEMDAKRAKTKAARERRQERVQAKRQQFLEEEEK
jgi:large subunit ribosomal protein L19e